MAEKALSRYIHTIKYLKPQQLFYRILYRIRKPIIQSKPVLQEHHLWAKPWCAPEVMPSPVINDVALCFLGEEGYLEEDNLWNSSKHSKLWLYNLHYFDAMNAEDASKNRNILNILLKRWIQENPPLDGNGWEPYPISLRIVNWVKWFLKYPNDVDETVLSSLMLQGEALVKQLEYHILGNHLFSNAKALVFVGCYFEGFAATDWLTKGLKLLDREIEEQFLLDGGHFELSPMYHATLLWDMCDLYNLALHSEIQVLLDRLPQWKTVIQRGLRWLFIMSHPDGDISFFNDATFGIAPKYEGIEAYAKQLNIFEVDSEKEPSALMLQHLKDTGYVMIDLPKKGKLILDVGEVGPDYQPGHAHADTLSFELSLFGQRVIVNSGISEYGIGELREYQRGTAAHNTVEINNKNSSDVWSGFRTAKRARPVGLKIERQTNQIDIICSHNGYTRLSSKNIHQRAWQVNKDKLLVIDQIQGHFRCAKARFYLHPSIKLLASHADEIVCCLSNGAEFKISLLSDGCLSSVSAHWYDGFNRVKENICIEVLFSSNKIMTQFEWLKKN